MRKSACLLLLLSGIATARIFLLFSCISRFPWFNLNGAFHTRRMFRSETLAWELISQWIARRDRNLDALVLLYFVFKVCQRLIVGK
jgi:hypothetical protein